MTEFQNPLGWRARLGVIIPTVNTVTEPEFNRILRGLDPAGVTTHFTRMPIHFRPEKDGYKDLMDDLQIRLEEFALFGADIVAYNCTVGSMACPPDLLIGKLESATGAPGVATAGSVVLALKALGADRISMATPYPDAVNDHEKAFLEGNGVAVVKMAGMSFDAVEPELGRKFSNLVVGKVLACSFVPGAREFLKAHHRSTPLFVVSGTPDEELAAIVAGRGLTPYFKGVYGSGRGKAEILRSKLADLACTARDLVFVGDGLTDFEAARAVAVPFVGRVRDGEDSPFPASTAVVSDLTGLDHALEDVTTFPLETHS